MATISLKLSDGSTVSIATGVSDSGAGTLGTTRGDLSFMVSNKLYYLDKGSYVLVRVGSKRGIYMEKTFANQKFLNTYVVSYKEDDNTIELVPRNTSRLFNFSEAYSNIGFVYPFSTLTASDVDTVLQNNCNCFIYPQLASALPSGWI
jgi:hypothetical protein